jgi:hypothetical protein
MFVVNAGAVQWLLDIAAEQEQKEMLLAYCFLWNGHQAPQPVDKDYAKTEVDSAIETFLRGDIKADQVARGSSQVCSNSTSLDASVFGQFSSPGGCRFFHQHHLKDQ